MQPLFTTNDADISKLEGLYIKERNPPASVVETSLNTVGVFGVTMKGPVGEAITITSEARFLEVFGGGYLNGVLVNDVWKSLLNKGMSKMVVCRVAAPAAVAASFTVETAAAGGGTAIARIDATSPGTWGNLIQFRVKTATDGNVNHWDLDVKDTITGRVYEYKNLDTTTGNNNLATVLGDDDGNPVVITKLADGRPVSNAAGVDGADSDGYVNLGETVTAFTSVAGTDGTVADADYYGTGEGLDILKAYPGIAIIYCAEYMSANLKSQMKTAAAAASDRMFIIGPNDETVTVASAITDAASYRGDRLIYAYNSAYTVDPVTGTEVLTDASSWMASILANTDVDIHPGEEDTKRFLAGITRLYRPALTRADYVDLRAAGISAMEVDLGSPVFVSGVVTDLTSGKTEITRRRMADFLQLSVANSLRFTVKKKNTVERRLANAGMINAFLKDLQKAGRVVEAYSVDGEILNTPTQRAAGIEKILMRVKLIGHMLHVVIETEIGTGVTITVQ